MSENRFIEISEIYAGSNGEATKALYDRFMTYEAAGLVAVNIFRAHKNSSRAKVYRGGIPGKGSYAGMAYERKQWAIDNLCKALSNHAEPMHIVWGWREDPGMSRNDPFRWVLYIDLPTGQVSFHNYGRGHGPNYMKEWDQTTRNKGADIICRWMVQVEREFIRLVAQRAGYSDSALRSGAPES